MAKALPTVVFLGLTLATAPSASMSLTRTFRSLVANIYSVETVQPLDVERAGPLQEALAHESPDGTHRASAAQTSDIRLEGGVLTVSGILDSDGLLASQSWSELAVDFHIDAPHDYYLSLRLGAGVRSMFGSTGIPFHTPGTYRGTLPPGDYGLFISADSRESPPAHAEVVFSLVPGPGSPPPTPRARATPGGVKLEWPVGTRNTILESAPDLRMGTTWTAVTNAIQTNGAGMSVLIEPREATRFFRLRRQP